MEDSRYRDLMNTPTLLLTADEVWQGWHFCREWDDLLIQDNDCDYCGWCSKSEEAQCHTM